MRNALRMLYSLVLPRSPPLVELIGNLSTLASVYHKPASSFVEGKAPVRHISLPVKAQP